MNGIVVAHNNGLGDLIVMNGCVRYLASQFDVLYLVCFDSRIKHYEFMYRDNDNIKLYIKAHPQSSHQARIRQVSAYEDIKKQNPEINWDAGLRRTYWTKPEEWKRFAQRLGLKEESITWPELFYSIMRVPYLKRYQNYNLKRDRQREENLFSKINLPKEYAFCVDDTRKFKFNIEWKTDLPIINPLEFNFWKDTLIFDWMKIIENATEIHTVDTSWMHLVRMMQLKIPKFYYQVRDVIMIEGNYLNDDFDNGWIRIHSKFQSNKIEKKDYWKK